MLASSHVESARHVYAAGRLRRLVRRHASIVSEVLVVPPVAMSPLQRGSQCEDQKNDSCAHTRPTRATGHHQQPDDGKIDYSASCEAYYRLLQRQVVIDARRAILKDNRASEIVLFRPTKTRSRSLFSKPHINRRLRPLMSHPNWYATSVPIAVAAVDQCCHRWRLSATRLHSIPAARIAASDSQAQPKRPTTRISTMVTVVFTGRPHESRSTRLRARVTIPSAHYLANANALGLTRGGGPEIFESALLPRGRRRSSPC